MLHATNFFSQNFQGQFYMLVSLLIEQVVNGKYKSMNIDFTANPTGHGGQLQAKSSFFLFKT